MFFEILFFNQIGKLYSLKRKEYIPKINNKNKEEPGKKRVADPINLITEDISNLVLGIQRIFQFILLIADGIAMSIFFFSKVNFFFSNIF